MNYRWTDKELILLKEYEILSLKLCLCDPEDLKESDQIRKFFLEARLLIMNKNVIGYLDGRPTEIYSFHEAQEIEIQFSKEGSLFTYHPLNFKIENQYIKYLNLQNI